MIAAFDEIPFGLLKSDLPEVSVEALRITLQSFLSGLDTLKTKLLVKL